MNQHIDRDNPDFKYENAVVIKFIDLDKYFAEFKDKAFIANDFQVTTEDRREQLLDRLTKSYIDDKFDEPINGENPLFENIEPSMWLRPIGKGVSFVHPKFITMLSRVLKKDRFDIVRHMMDPSYKPPALTPKGIVKTYVDANFPRGMKEFEENFDEMMELLIFEQYRKREAKRASPVARRRNSKRNALDYMAMIIEKYRDILFCKQLPIPSRHVFVLEKKGKNKASEVPLMYHAFDAVSVVTSISDRIKPPTKKEADRLDFKVNFTCMAAFYENYGSNYLKSKPGVFRKNSYGTSTSFNARAVIVSRQGVHDYDVLECAYPIAFKLFEQHVAKIVIDQHSYNPLDIFEMRSNYARQFNPKIHGIMTKLIGDYWGGRGWALNFLRQPFLSTLSSQGLFLGKIGTDALDHTFGFSPLTLKGPNADFDGDEMVGSLHLDKRMFDLNRSTQPHFSALDQNEALSYSGDLDLPKPIMTQFHRWLGYDKL